MHATIRSYIDPGLADMLASNKDEVEVLMAGVPGSKATSFSALQRVARASRSVTAKKPRRHRADRR